jgi:hypothetical protein
MIFIYCERKCGHMEMFATFTLLNIYFLVAECKNMHGEGNCRILLESRALLLQKYVPTGAKTMNKYLCTRRGQQTP